MATLTRAIPALPVRDAEVSVASRGEVATRDLDDNLVTFVQWVAS